VDEVSKAISTLINKSGNNAKGNDGIAYTDLCNTDQAELCSLLNRCLKDNVAPSIQLATVIIGILKKGKPGHEPESYCAIGLESCMLKPMTLLIHN